MLSAKAPRTSKSPPKTPRTSKSPPKAPKAPPSTPTHELVDPDAPAHLPTATATATLPADSTATGEHKTKRGLRLRSGSTPRPLAPRPTSVDPPPSSPTRRRAHSIDSDTTPLPDAPDGAPNSRSLLRAALGDDTLTRASTLPLDLDVLPKRPGLVLFLQRNLRSDADLAPLRRFLPLITGTDDTAKFSPDQLEFLYARHADLDGKPGLTKFLITKIRQRAALDDLDSFHGQLGGDTDLTEPQLEFLFQRRASLQGRPTLTTFLAAKLRDGDDLTDLDAFHRTVSGTAAADFPPEALGFLYARHAELVGKPGLTAFLITKLRDATDLTDLDAFHKQIGGDTDLSEPHLDFLFQRRVSLQGRPALTTFLAAKLRGGEDPTALAAFHQELSDTAADLHASALDFLYARRAHLLDRPALQEFLVARLAARDDEAELADFHSDALGTPAERFGRDQLDFLYARRAALRGKASLRAFVVEKLEAQGKPDQLGDFLDAIAGTDAERLSAAKLSYLHELQPEFGATATVKVAGHFVTKTLQALATERLTTGSVADLHAELTALRPFGYNERLYTFARGQADARGKRVHAADREALDKAEALEIEAAKAQLSLERPADPGPQPSLSGREKKKLPQWKLDKAAYDEFPTKVLPGRVAEASVAIKAKYDLQRRALDAQLQAGTYAAPELAQFAAFLATNKLHADAEWALGAAGGDLSSAQILFEACQGDLAMKQVGDWAGKQNYSADRLQRTLAKAQGVGLDLTKTKLVVPYLLDCPDLATQTWLTTHAATASAADLGDHIALLRTHKPATLPLLIQAIGLFPDKARLAAHNNFLKNPALGAPLLTLVQTGAYTAKVADLFTKMAHKEELLAAFLQAGLPLRPGYASFEQVCAHVKLSPSSAGAAIDDVTWALNEAGRSAGLTTATVGKGYVEHVLKRVAKGAKKVDLAAPHNFGLKEWLFITSATEAGIHADHSLYKAPKQPKNAWTGVFTITLEGVAIEVHNHFVRGGAQYSLHLKDGTTQGQELTAQDGEVYTKISQLCLARYTAWANGRWPVYTV